MYIDGDEFTPSMAQRHLHPETIKEIMNPSTYIKLLTPFFEKQAEDAEPPEPDFNEPDYDDRY